MWVADTFHAKPVKRSKEQIWKNGTSAKQQKNSVNANVSFSHSMPTQLEINVNKTENPFWSERWQDRTEK